LSEELELLRIESGSELESPVLKLRLVHCLARDKKPFASGPIAISILFEREDVLRSVAAEFDVGIDNARVRAAFLALRPFDTTAGV